MICELSKTCIYYNTHRYKSTSKQYSLLVESYCEGQLQSMCRRKQYKDEFYKAAPEDMAPNGYRIGSHKKLRAENTRKHKRYEVKSGTCLLQEPSSKSTFTAEVIDVSQGGLKLAASIEPHTIKTDSEPIILKILGHTIGESPISFTRDFIKIVWQQNQVFGCAFVTPVV